MQFHVMSKEELEISNIDKIRSITLYNILDPKSSNLDSLVGIITICDDSRNFNYIQTDKYFDFYLKKVISQYEIEKDNIDISDNLKAFFDSQDDNIYDDIKLFLNANGFIKQKIKYNQIKINEYKNIIFYLIQSIGKLTNNDFKINGEIKGYRNIFKVNSYKNNKPISLNLIIEELDDFKIKLKVCDFFDVGNDLNIEIDYLESKININWFNNESLSGYLSYYYNGENMMFDSTIYQKDKIIFYDRDKIVECNKDDEVLKNLLKIFGFNAVNKIIKFPWGDYRIIIQNDEKIGKEELKENITYLDLTFDNNNAFLKRQSTSTLFNFNKKYKLTIDGIKSKNQLLLINDKSLNYGLLETRFYENNISSSTYQTKLANRYFYQGFRTDKDSLEEIDVVELSFIHDISEYDDGYNLLKADKIRKNIRSDK